MATIQKGKGAIKKMPSTTTKKRTTTPNTASKGSSSRTPKKSAPPSTRPIRREVGGLIAILMAVFVVLGYFGINAIFIDFVAVTLKGLVGYGYWLVAPTLGLVSYILIFHRGRPVILRIVCAFLVPLVVGCAIHGLMAEVYPWNFSIVSTMWTAGQSLQTAGVLGGVIAQVFVQIFSQLGATIVFGICFILTVLGGFNRTLSDVADWIFNRPEYEYKEKAEKEPIKTTPRFAPPQVKAHRSAIDIPMEPAHGAESAVSEIQVQEPQKEKKIGFFNRKSKVPAPHEFLANNNKQETEPPVVSEIQPVTAVFIAPLVAPLAQPELPITPQAVDVPLAEPIREAVPTKLKKEETAEAARQVAEDIAETLQQGGEHPYKYPPLSLLNEMEPGDISGVNAELTANQKRLSDTIRSFGIDANIANVTRGPSVTRYELELDQGVRLNKLTNLSDDIALALGATGVRIAPIPDKISMVGIEVPNKLVSPVSMHTVIGSKEFTSSKSKVSFSVGKDIAGDSIIGDIAKLPHLLIAGTTGSGKSVCTNSLIISLLYKATPDEVRLIMVDPKMVELGIYNGIPHLLIPVVTDPKKAAGALQWAVSEMMKRYRVFSEVGVRDLASYNSMAAKTDGMEKMPQIVVVIDELADLMLVAAKEVEESICRVAQMGRASGMHLIIATQRPSADVITGLMKANIPSRIAFAVASALESRIILDTQGAEKLVGRGDMLYAPLGAGKPARVQGCFISDREVAAVVNFVKESGNATYSEAIMQEIEKNAAAKEKGNRSAGASSVEANGGDYDELIDAATEVILDTKQASVSMLQRRLKLGYARAARLVDQLEEKGIVGPFEGSKPRQLLITKEQWQEMKFRQGGGNAPATQEKIPEVLAPIVAAVDAEPFDVERAIDETEDVF